MKVFISGGCKNGKSMYAQNLAKKMADELGTKMYYVATMLPRDDEDKERIKRHVKERDGFGFETIEKSRNISEILDNMVDVKGVFLIDSLTALLQNQMFLEDEKINEHAAEDVIKDLTFFAKKAPNVIFVSDYIYSDAIQYDHSIEQYKEALAKVDKQIAKLSDKVCEVTYSNVIDYK